MNIVVNGSARPVPAGATVASLIAGLGLDGRRVAVERNGVILKQDDYASTPLQEGDRLEIVHFVGGGDAPKERSCTAGCRRGRVPCLRTHW